MVPGVQPGIHLYNAEGNLIRTWDSELVGLDTDCSTLSPEQIRRYATGWLPRVAWLNQRRTLDEILPLSDGRRANGKVVDKVTFLKDLATPGNTNERLDTDQIEVLPYGDDVALCSVLVRFRGTRGGTAVDGVFRNTRVFVRRDAVWRCALWFNTKES